MKKCKELLFMKNLKGIGDATINSKFFSLIERADGLDALECFVLKNEKRFCRKDIVCARAAAEKKYEELSVNAAISIITIFDKEYPDRLMSLKNKKPVVLYAKGNVDCLDAHNIAVVGTRSPSPWSTNVETRLVQSTIELSGRTIVSGLALGCDTISHQVAVNNNMATVAILPSGFNEITPASNKSLAQKIIDTGGCLITTYEPTVKANKYTFVYRDMLIAAFSDGIIAIECGAKSGTMHTINAAVKLNRKVACYYTQDLDKGKYDGNQYMIKTMGASIISNKNELESFLSELPSNAMRDVMDYKCPNQQFSMFGGD